MKLLYRNPDAEGVVISYNHSVKHGDIIDTSRWGAQEEHITKKALNSPYYTEYEEPAAEKEPVEEEEVELDSEEEIEAE